MRVRQSHRGVSVESARVRRTAIHRHSNIIELVYVLQGEMHVQVSSERFRLEYGDFAVLNAGDPHVFDAKDEAVIATVQIDIAEFIDDLPELTDAIFACESFDLPRYFGTESRLRDSILQLLEAPAEERHNLTSALILELLETYGIEQYYDRRRILSHKGRETLRRILSLIREYATERDVLDRISTEMNYSKGALSRLFRDSIGMSFSDALSATRLARAEMMLLDTEDTMVAISAACGFSDVKYFTRAFRTWFGGTPAEYRRANASRMGVGDDIDELDDQTGALVQLHRETPVPVGRPLRRSETPIQIHTSAIAPEPLEAMAVSHVLAEQPPPDSPHILPIRIPKNASSADNDGAWLQILENANRQHYLPVILVSLSDRDKVDQLFKPLVKQSDNRYEIWISYALGEEREAEEFARDLRDQLQVVVTPMLGT